MTVATSITELIGNTPLVRLSKLEKKNKLHGNLIAKVEMFNPGGSAKDRIAMAMLDDAERKGLLVHGSTIVEPTSGNTGIGLAMLGAARGYRVILTMPNTMSVERRSLLAAYGAHLELVDGKLGMKGCIEKAEALAASIPGSFMPRQFENPANPAIHQSTTGMEIWEATQGNIDFFVAGVGTGGTITGVGRALKERKPNVQVVAVEPQGSPMLSAGKAGAHKIQGIGAGFIPRVLDTNIYDHVIAVSDENALSTGRDLARYEGLLTGISSGAATFAGIQLACLPENSGKNIVVFLPDTGERYLSSAMYKNETQS